MLAGEDAGGYVVVGGDVDRGYVVLAGVDDGGYVVVGVDVDGG